MLLPVLGYCNWITIKIFKNNEKKKTTWVSTTKKKQTSAWQAHPPATGPDYSVKRSRGAVRRETPPHTRRRGKAWVVPVCNGSKYWGTQWLRKRGHDRHHRDNEKITEKMNSGPLPPAAPATYYNLHPLQTGLSIHMAFFTYTDNVSLSSLRSVFQRFLIYSTLCIIVKPIFKVHSLQNPK